jgi:trans-aconitate methyltransferase
MTESDPYFLSCRRAEFTRLQDQAQQLGDEARWLFDQLDLESGARVVEIGCGPLGYLDLLAEHVGPAGTVVGLERSVEAVALARQCASEHYLEHIEVLHYFQAWGRKPGGLVCSPDLLQVEADVSGGRRRSSRPIARRV